MEVSKIPKTKKSLKSSQFGVIAFGSFLLSKFKVILSLLKLSKFGATLISMIVSLSGYAVAYGWKFAAALVYVIFIHEMGHLIAAKQKGIETSPAIFIPFVGAVVSLKDYPKNAETEAYLAYGGPFAGFLSIIPAIILYIATNNPYFILVITLGAMVNLFNLIPVLPLDGGRIVTILSPKLWFVGLVIIGLMIWYSFSPILLLIFFLGVVTWYQHVRRDYRSKLLLAERKIIEGNLLFYENILHSTSILERDDWELLAFKSEKEMDEIIAEIDEKKGFYLPFLHDDKKLVIDILRKRESHELEKFLFIKEAEEGKAFNQYQKQWLKWLHQLEGEIEKAKFRYYHTSLAKKWIYLGLYLSLAAVLAITLYYGMELLDSYQYLITPVG